MSDIFITADEQDGQHIPTTSQWPHALDGIRGLSRDALADAIVVRVNEKHLAQPGDKIHVVEPTGETIVSVPRVA